MRFDTFHPMINLIYFASAIACTILFDHPVFLVIAYGCAFVYSIKLNGKRSVIFNLCLLPLIGAYTAWYSYYNHFGVTNLRANFIGNQITLEAVTVGLVRGIKIASVLMMGSCILTVVSSDKVVYLFGRISPKLSLFLSILLRFIPRVKQRAKKIELSRKGIGMGCGQGKLWQILRHTFSFLSILITWTLEDFVESAASMKNRGYSLKGRTAFSIYRFDNRDRSFVLALFGCLTVVTAAVLFDQTNISYNPQIILNRITPLSVIFYATYGIFLLLPMTVQVIGELRWKRH